MTDQEIQSYMDDLTEKYNALSQAFVQFSMAHNKLKLAIKHDQDTLFEIGSTK